MNSHIANTNLGNVIQLAPRKQAEDIASYRAAEDAVNKFVVLMRQHGCKWASLGGSAPDGTRFHVFSHSLADDSKPGVEVLITPPQK